MHVHPIHCREIVIAHLIPLGVYRNPTPAASRGDSAGRASVSVTIGQPAG
jgi:hypothetical protein